MRSAVAALLVLALLPMAGCLGGGDKDPAVVPPPCDPCEDCLDGGDAICVAPEPDPLPPAVPAWPHFPSDGAVEYTTLEIPSFDEHQIPISIHKPKVASAEQKVPVLLHSHGFTGKRATAEDAFTPLVGDPHRAGLRRGAARRGHRLHGHDPHDDVLVTSGAGGSLSLLSGTPLARATPWPWTPSSRACWT